MAVLLLYVTLVSMPSDSMALLRETGTNSTFSGQYPKGLLETNPTVNKQGKVPSIITTGQTLIPNLCNETLRGKEKREVR